MSSFNGRAVSEDTGSRNLPFPVAFATENESMPKIIINDTINLFFELQSHFGNFKL